jgi:Ras-related C3 botulinum toxin substrate 1
LKPFCGDLPNITIIQMQDVKCVVVGDQDIGKTCLLITYTSNAFPQENVPPAMELWASTIPVKGKEITFRLWDTRGHQDFDHVRPLAYPQTDVFLVCFSVTSPVSFENVLTRWLPEIKQHSPDTPILLVGTKSDLRVDKSLADMMIEKEHALKLMKEIGAVEYHEVSALTSEGVKYVLDRAMEIGAKMPESTSQDKCSLS